MSARGLLDRLRLALGYYPNSADEWAVRVQSHDIARHEFVALDEWLKADPRNAEDYARFNKVAHLGLRLRDHPELRARIVHFPLPAGPAEDSRRFPASRRWRLSLAAAACLLVAIGVGWVFIQQSSLFAPSYSAARGEQRQVSLADGSRMTVNTDTEVRVRFDADRRALDLVRGEAYFEVAKDAARPFVVRAGRTEVRAIGTKFSVRRDADDTEVVVTEGQVQVVREARGSEPAPATKPVDLVSGTRARVVASQPAVQVAVVDTARAIAWTAGNVDFDEATLAEVLRDVNRYTTRQFVIADPSLANLRLSGRFRVGDIESVRAALRDRFDIAATEDKDVIRLTRAR